ncbi:hypothetical protein N7452_006734 [Penicillium brevicompactum]|uniref:Uncharacterized protein n=1 Tax=Penicillium brevicompactum TaxID=5074 RepID=A0A9W9QL30_PENBR|nr:hypothetical protein N7452_006734 [Penicillium brevicompactum]
MDSNDAPATRLAPQPASSNPTTVPMAKRRPGRTFKNPQRSSSSRSRSGPYNRPSNSPRPSRSHTSTPNIRMLSMLEALPAEVIEQIFLHSLNLNLPQASPFLSRVLSREHMYRTLILLAFWDDPPSYPGSDAINKMMVGPLEYVPLSLEERTRLQKKVFKCKWLTRERVLEQVPTMQILTVHRQWINAGVVVDKAQQQKLERFLAREINIDTPTVFKGQGPPMLKLLNYLLSTPFGAEFRRMCPNATKPGPHPYELVIEPMQTTNIRCASMLSDIHFPVLNLREFPEHLLRGRSTGFLPEDVAFMEMLRMTSSNWTDGTRKATETIFNRKAVNEGIQNAIRNQNLSALRCLLKIDEYSIRFSPQNVTRDIIYKIPQEHFLAVVRTGRDNPRHNLALFEALLRASAESVPTQSSEMTEWIVENVNLYSKDPNPSHLMNVRLAHWLLDWQMLLSEHLRDLDNGFASQLFVCGGLNMQDSEGQIFNAKVLRPEREPWGNWIQESPFQSEKHWIMKKTEPSLNQ